MSYQDLVTQHLRFATLRILADERNHASNDSLITDELRRIGFNPTRDAVRAELRWLESVAAVGIDDTTLKGTWVVTLRERGLDHIERRLVIDGVRRPSPER